MAEMTFIKAGLFTSVQDMGRFGFRKYGVPISGAMDLRHARLANLLVNNPIELPVLEITLMGPEIFFDEDAIIAISGADLSPSISDKPVSMNAPTLIRAGETLRFGKRNYGVRAYLAVKNGFKSEQVLGSFSQYATITNPGRVEKEYKLQYESSTGPLPNTAVKPSKSFFDNKVLEVIHGPEYGELKPEEKSALQTELVVGTNNRMGYQLSAEKPVINEYSMITAPVIPGTVQLTPSGKLIVLMRDGQISGGYPRVLQLTESSINRLAQKSSGEKIRFRLKEL